MSGANDPTRLMQGVIPYLALANAREAIAFYQQAFGAELVGDIADMPGTTQVANASLAINGGVLMVCDAAPEHGQPAARGGHGITMQLVIEDGDLWWARAVQAGCEIRTPFAMQFWGDRYGAVRDPYGIDWAFNEPSDESKAKMREAAAAAPAPGLVEDLSITRILAAPRSAVWRCWTEGDLLKQWFCPKPWYVSVADIDVRPGGASRIVMNGPNGEMNDLPGQYLAVVPQTHLSTTDAFIGDWRPSLSKPFMTSFVDLSDEPDGKTKMIWGARHWNAEDRAMHLAMGFEAGWNAAADQLETLAQSIA